MNRKANAACNFNYLFENERLLKVAGSHVYRKCGSISENGARWSRCYYRPLIGSDMWLIK